MRIVKVLLVSMLTFAALPSAVIADGNIGEESKNEKEKKVTEVSEETTESTETSTFDWNPIMDAIIQVESGGNRMARNGNQVGCMQITPACVTQCNVIMKTRNDSRRFTMADRYSVEKSKEMFLVVQSYYNPENNVEKAIRSWNGGPGYSLRGTQRYYQKVMSYID